MKRLRVGDPHSAMLTCETALPCGRYSKEWEKTVTRLGRWIDFENDYKTLDPKFMESVWWVFGELWAKDLVYKGFKVSGRALGAPFEQFGMCLRLRGLQGGGLGEL